MQIIRKESQQNKGLIKKLTIYEKIDLSKNLLKIIEYGEPYNLVNTLFGYTLSFANIPLDDRIAFDLK
jgi:hypothetical protein